MSQKNRKPMTKEQFCAIVTSEGVSQESAEKIWGAKPDNVVVYEDDEEKVRADIRRVLLINTLIEKTKEGGFGIMVLRVSSTPKPEETRH